MKNMMGLLVLCLLLAGLNANAFDCSEDIRAGIESGVSTDGKAFENGGGFLSITGINQCEAGHICQSLGMRLPALHELQANYEVLGRNPYHDADQNRVWTSSNQLNNWAFLFYSESGSHKDEYRAYRHPYYSARCMLTFNTTEFQ